MRFSRAGSLRNSPRLWGHDMYDSRRTLRLALFASAILACASPSHAALLREGGEFQVNTLTAAGAYFGSRQSVARSATGGSFMVVWQSYHEPDVGVSGQRFDSAGKRIGGEFTVNSYSSSAQYDPNIAATPDGGFVVVWWSTPEPRTAPSVSYQAISRSASRWCWAELPPLRPDVAANRSLRATPAASTEALQR